MIRRRQLLSTVLGGVFIGPELNTTVGEDRRIGQPDRFPMAGMVETADWLIDYTLDIEKDGLATVTVELDGSEIPDSVRLKSEDVTDLEFVSGQDAVEANSGHPSYQWDTTISTSVQFTLQLGQNTHGSTSTAVLDDSIFFMASEINPVTNWSGGRNAVPDVHRVRIQPPGDWNVAAPGKRNGTNTFDLFPKRAYVTQLRELFAVGDFTVHTGSVDGTEVRVVALPSTEPPPMDDFLSILEDVQPIIERHFGEEVTYPRLGIVVTLDIGGGPGGMARNNSFHVTDTEAQATESIYDLQTGMNVPLHEYVHTFHRFRNPDWQAEGQASWIDRLSLYESGHISESELRTMFQNRTERRSQPKDAPANESTHTKGSLIYAALDMDIRARTDGQEDIGSYLPLVNDQRGDPRGQNPPALIDRTEALTALYKVTSVDYTDFFERYVDSAEYPDEVESDEFSVTDPQPVEFAAFEYATTRSPSEELFVDEELTMTIEICNVGTVTGQRTLEIKIRDDMVATTDVELEPDESTTLTFDYSFPSSGTYHLTVNEVPIEPVSVETKSTPTATPTATPLPTPTDTPTPTSTEPPDSKDEMTAQTTDTDVSPTAEAESPGFGITTAIAGIGSVLGYYLYKSKDKDP